MTSSIQTFPLGSPPWPTVDPFLFCVHHFDRFPVGNERLGPDPALLRGRSIGQDFADVDGWNMYHGSVVPGFPAHPHRGFETITLVRRGVCDHHDSLGAKARFGSGDVQWLTAGKGIQHSEMFPLVDDEHPNTLQLFQIWLNLPAADKMVDPYFTMLWAPDIPRVTHKDDDGRRVEIEVVAGRLGDAEPASPPPNSWAARADAEVVVWHVTAEPGARWSIPAQPGVNRTFYAYEGAATVGGEAARPDQGVSVTSDDDVAFEAGADGASLLVLGGRPIGEPVAQYGPFVMNTRDEIVQAFDDYQATRFGGWPFAADDPDHGRDAERFAVHPDGRHESPGS